MKSWQLPAVLLAYLVTSSVMAGDIPEPFLGEWEIDHERTMAVAEKSPKYKESERDMISNIVRRRAETMTLSITPAAVTLRTAKGDMEIPVTVEDAADGEVNLDAEFGDQEFELDLVFIGEEHLQMISSASDDMNFFAWKAVSDQ